MYIQLLKHATKYGSGLAFRLRIAFFSSRLSLAQKRGPARRSRGSCKQRARPKEFLLALIPRGIFRDASLKEHAGQGCAWAQQQCRAQAQGFGHLYVVLVESASTRYSFCPPFLSFWYQDGLSRTSKRYWRINSGAAVPSQPPSRLTGGGQ